MTEDVDEIIKSRERKKKLEEGLDMVTELLSHSIKEKDEMANQIIEERRTLEKLRKEREIFIKERDIETQIRFSKLENKIVAGQQKLGDLEKEASQLVVDIEKMLKTATDGSLSLITRADELTLKSDNLMKQAEATIGILKKYKEDLDKKTLKNSELEKEVLTREKEVEVKNKKAEEKLKEAKDLAFWHKEPGARYQEK